jgi:hypothetical protein
MQQRDTLTPLDARNSLLLDRPVKTASSDASSYLSISKTGPGYVTVAEQPPKDTSVAIANITGGTRSTSPERYHKHSSSSYSADRLSNPMFAPRGTNNGNGNGPPSLRPLTPNTPLPLPGQNPSRENLLSGMDMRQPTLPDLGSGFGGNGGGSGYRPQGSQGPQGPQLGYGNFGVHAQQQQQTGYGQAGYGGGYRGPYGRY